MRTASEICATIAREFGGVPPFFAAAAAAPAVLDALWRQTVAGHLRNPLPALFKECLLAYLARYCRVPYLLVCHSCALRPLGLKGGDVLALLEEPPPAPGAFAEPLSLLEEAPAPLSVWPGRGTPLGGALFRLSVAAFTGHPQADPVCPALRRLLGPALYPHWLALLSCAHGAHLWAEAHPELAPEDDPRARAHLGALLEEEPRLAGFFRTYRERVRGETRRREQDLPGRADPEAARAAAEAALRDADRRKDDFLAMLAHELRNPLGPVRNALTILRHRGDDRAMRDWARDVMERQVGHLSRIVEDLLEVSRIIRGKIQLRPERLDLARHVRHAVEDHRPALEGRGLSLCLELPGAPLWLTADPTRLAQVMDNLLSNAGKFTEPGGHVRVGVTAERRGAGDGAAVTVADTGVGIEPGALPHLFDSLFQADRSLERSRGGLGLGLALVRGLVELHGGQVSASSAGVGHGSEFTVWLPVSEPAADPPGPVTAGAAGGLRVLLVEDNRDAAETLRLLLETCGHEVAVAHDGVSGVAEARRFRPDVVFCDLGLPGLDGYGVARELRRDPATARARLVAVTGYGRDEDRQRARQAGFDQHFIKPVEPEEIRRLLSEVEPQPR